MSIVTRIPSDFFQKVMTATKSEHVHYVAIYRYIMITANVGWSDAIKLYEKIWDNLIEHG